MDMLSKVRHRPAQGRQEVLFVPWVGQGESTLTDEDELIARLRAHQASKGKVEEPQLELDTPDTPEPDNDFDSDLIPDVEAYERSDEDLEIDAVLGRLDILDAYQRWCGKMTPKVGGKRESIMVSCPMPNHADKNPSAWLNLDKDTWYCGGCMVGGDKYDIAAMRLGYAYPETYKNDGSFPELRREMAEEMGYVVRRTPGGQEYVEKIEGSDFEESNIPSSGVTDNQDSVASYDINEPDSSDLTGLVPINLSNGGADNESSSQSNVINFPTTLPSDPEAFHKRVEEAGAFIDWETIVTPGTFLWEWMQATTIDDLPHEYYFWLAMQAIGFAAGTDVLMDDYRRIKPNIFVCLYGSTGSGKSRAIEPYGNLLREALPRDDADDYTPSKGVDLLASPASAEALLRMFQHDIKDPSTNAVIEQAQVKGLLRIEEFASFVSRASRPTNPMKETLIELYDVLDHTMKHTSVTGGTVRAANPFAQMVTSTQPKAIHAFLRRNDTESGFLNRWIFATGNRRRRRISYGGVQIDIQRSVELLRDLASWCGRGHRFTLTGDALQVWDDFFHETIVPLHDNMNESMLSRIDLLLKKLIILFTINDKEAQPTAETVRKAISIFPYLRLTSVMFSTDIGYSEFEHCRIEVLEALRTQAEGITTRVLLRILGDRHEKQLLVQVLRTMVDLGEIQEILQKGKRGPATAKYAAVD